MSSPSPSASPRMAVWIYDHCPYCTRVRIIIGLKKLPVDIKILGNSDEKGHIDLCGKKQVPILKKMDGSILLESLDIVKFLDEFDGKSLLEDGNKNKEIYQKWTHSNKLTHPRFIQLGLEEFKTKEDIEYFTAKKTKDIGDFKENLDKTQDLIKEEEIKMKDQLEKIIPPVDELKKGKGGLNGNFSYDDIHLFPRLRSLTCVKGFKFPDNIRFYIDNLAKLSNIDLFDNRAV